MHLKALHNFMQKAPNSKLQFKTDQVTVKKLLERPLDIANYKAQESTKAINTMMAFQE